jgi:hypothetical protein
VATLYEAAKADLTEDIARVSAARRYTTDKAKAAFWLGHPARTQRGNPKVPVLRMHTIGDPQVPASQMQVYNAQIRANRKSRFYRPAYVSRQGHILFTVAEAAVAMETLLSRLDLGAWPDTSAKSLNSLAAALNVGKRNQANSAFVDCSFREFNGAWRLNW